MGWWRSVVAAALATLAHPRWWVLALAGFLVRGGVFLILLPMIVPPTVAGVMSLLAPTVVGAVIIGGPNTPIAFVGAVTALILFVLVAIAGTLGATFDAALARDAADDEDLRSSAADEARAVVGGPFPPGLGTVRLGPHIVTAIVLAVVAARVFRVIYAEATSPGAPTTPFFLRVVGETPGELATLIVVLLVADTVGGLALRALLLDPGVGQRGLAFAIVRAIRTLLRPTSIAALAVTTIVTLVIALPGALAAARAWSQVRLLFGGPVDALGLAVGLFLFVAVVLGWLALLGVALAWRSTVWTAISATSRARAAT